MTVRGKYAVGVAAVAAGVLALAGCGAAATPGQSASKEPEPYRVKADTLPTYPGGIRTVPGPSPTGTCPESGLTVTAGEPDAAMGLRAAALYVTNCGTSPHKVSGYPLTHVLDEDLNRVEVTVHQGSSITTGIDDPAPTTVELAPGQRATATLVWRNTVTDATVVATTGAFVEITPVKGAPPQLAPMMIDLGNTGKLDVTAWRRSAD
ncbi:DUF4232 domain-containing protein [Actinacidiphila alni]|uniref:DUF4232 domain-containing protein n=1 Tax=Actinacidiphila alni TaxID=380248 RepID=UPI003454E92D